MNGERIANKIWVEKPKGKKSLGRPRYMWVENTEMDLREIRLGGMAWIGQAEDRDQWQAP
jgi:hypothetical protein